MREPLCPGGDQRVGWHELGDKGWDPAWLDGSSSGMGRVDPGAGEGSWLADLWRFLWDPLTG